MVPPSRRPPPINITHYIALHGTTILYPPTIHSYVVDGVLILFFHPVRLKSVLIHRRRRLLKYGPSVYVVKCRFSMNSLSVPFGRRSLWTPPWRNHLNFIIGIFIDKIISNSFVHLIHVCSDFGIN